VASLARRRLIAGKRVGVKPVSLTPPL